MKKKIKKPKNKIFNLENQYEKSFNYISESRKFISTIIVVFFIFALIGYVIPTPEFIIDAIFEFIQELLEKTEAMSQTELIRFIFLNNLQSSFFGMIFGFFLGIFPVIATIANGYLLGFVAKVTVGEEGFLVLWRLLPHGIFELPAVFISLGLGLKFGTFLFQKKKGESFKNFFWSSLRVFIFIVIPLLVIAAIIEGSLIAIFG
ncbi:MAG: stage II sporulation protein M [Candidatus Nanoarchaeia archaeon]